MVLAFVTPITTLIGTGDVQRTGVGKRRTRWGNDDRALPGA